MWTNERRVVDPGARDKPDAVIFIPVDDVAMIDSVKQLNEAKIRGAGINPLPGSFVTYVGTDDFEIGYRRRAISLKARRQGKDCRDRGHSGGADNRERLRGYQRAFAEFPGIEVLSSKSATINNDVARRAMEKASGGSHPADRCRARPMTAALGVLER